MIRYALMLAALLLGAPFVHAAEDAASASASAPAATTAVPMSEGEIRKVDAAAGKLTIQHGPLVNLGMEPMTMVFRVQDPVMLSKVRPGSKVRFVAEKINGVLTVTALEVD